MVNVEMVSSDDDGVLDEFLSCGWRVGRSVFEHVNESDSKDSCRGGSGNERCCKGQRSVCARHATDAKREILQGNLVLGAIRETIDVIFGIGNETAEKMFERLVFVTERMLASQPFVEIGKAGVF